ncbi:MAG: right-handed parallel beta-helix repeat-containing protein [bacterium]
MRGHATRVVFLASMLHLVLAFGVSGAATHRVPSEYPTIQSGLDASVAGDTVLVAPGRYTDAEVRIGGTYPAWSCAFLVGGVTLLSEAGPESTWIDMDGVDGPQSNVIWAWQLPGETRIEGFTITGTAGIDGKGIYDILSDHLVVERCVFRDLEENAFGAGIAADGNISVIDCLFVDCTAGSAGAGIRQVSGHIDLIRCTFRNCGNIAVYLADEPDPYPSSSLIEDCLFEDCHSGSFAGALHIYNHANGGVVQNCVFRNNSAAGEGGAIVWGNFGDKLIENNIFVNNTCVGGSAQGGAIYVSGNGPCTIRGNTFYGNSQVLSHPQGGGAAVRLLAPAVFENNIVAASSGNFAISTSTTWSPSCNVYWENEVGIGVPLDGTDREVDPLFCDITLEDFTLQSNSPCLPDSSGGCGQIGALGVGCDPISVDAETWARIKNRFREGVTR